MNLQTQIENYFLAWSRQAPDAVMEFFTENSTFEDLAFAVKFEGLQQIRSFVDLTYSAVPDFTVDPKQIIIQESSGAAAWIMQGTHSGDFPGLPATGKRFEVRASSIVNFNQDGMINSIVDYWNPLEFRAAVGL